MARLSRRRPRVQVPSLAPYYQWVRWHPRSASDTFWPAPRHFRPGSVRFARATFLRPRRRTGPVSRMAQSMTGKGLVQAVGGGKRSASPSGLGSHSRQTEARSIFQGRGQSSRLRFFCPNDPQVATLGLAQGHVPQIASPMIQCRD